MKRKLKILSIDWDYFIDVTLEQIAMQFPSDKNNSINQTMSDFEWAEKYSKYEDISNIKTTKDITFMIEYLKSLKDCKLNKSKMFVADSHEQIKKFLKVYLDKKQPIEAVCLNRGGSNWLSSIGKQVLKEKALLESCIHKINREQVQEEKNSDGINIKETNNVGEKMLDVLLKHFYEKECPDLILVSRQSHQTPPHLDDELEKMIYVINYISVDVLGEGIYNRYSDKFLSLVDEIKTSDGEF